MIQAKRNECLRLVRISNRKINDCRIGENEGKKHADMKEKICKELTLQGKSFVTEAIFENGSRCDILVLDDFKVIEIVDTESEKSLSNKQMTYPKGLKIEVIKVGIS